MCKINNIFVKKLLLRLIERVVEKIELKKNPTKFKFYNDYLKFKLACDYYKQKNELTLKKYNELLKVPPSLLKKNKDI